LPDRSLNYGYLEDIFRVIFAFATGFTDRPTSALFERLNNKARQDVLDQMLSSALLLPKLKALVRHFSKGFAICANRHAIMHSHHGGIHSESTRPCLVCGRQPSDARHIQFARPRAMGLKFSDEFTVPLCRLHHRELHQTGNEKALREASKIQPLGAVKQLWREVAQNCFWRTTKRNPMTPRDQFG